MRVASVMRSHVVTLPPESTVAAVVDVLDVYQQAIVPVVDEAGRLRGALDAERIAGALATGEATGGTVVSNLENDLLQLDEGDDAVTAAIALARSGKRGAVVVADGRVVGLMGLPEACRALVEGR